MPTLRAHDIDALVVGVSLLGSGGGGDASSFTHVLRQRLGDGEIVLHPPSALGDARTVPVGMVGATSVFAEKLPSGEELRSAVMAVARWTGEAPEAVMAVEAAGLNGVTALVAALDLGLPYLDADLTGRALPRLDQSTWAALGRPVAPAAVCEPAGQAVVVADTDATGLERTLRAVLGEVGGWAGLALSAAPARAAATDACTGTLGRALELGRAHGALRMMAESAEVAEAFGGRALADGRIYDITRHGTAAGYAGASVTVLDRRGAVVRLEAENEFLLALVDGEPVASCPDLLCVLDRRTARPLAVDAVRRGDEVLVVVLPAPPWWAEHGHLDLVGPSAFGLDCPPLLLGATS
jgi:hypothetical protein